MTVPIYNLLTQYTGTGSRTFFEYGFEIFDDTSVFVLVNGLPVTVVMQDTGIVIDPAPALNATILIYRQTDVTQLRDFQPFESFKADKTESAVDKLIYLKQEADLWRALCNLYALPYVDRVEIINDKGTDAVIFLWNLNKAGMFSGTLTDDMPNPGMIVEKPEDFAYFECGGAIPVIAEIWTTTPYPIEVIEELQLDMDINFGSMVPIPSDEAEYDADITGAGLDVVLLTYGPDNDNAEYDADIISAGLDVILLTYGPDEDEADYDADIVDAGLDTYLVTVDTPDEKLQLDMDIVPGGCSMDAV